MLSIIITSYKEPKTIGRAIESVADTRYSGLNEPFELITVIPDRATRSAAAKTAQKFKHLTHIDLKDRGLSKPDAINLGLKHAKGDIVVFTDGDMYLGRNAIPELVDTLRKHDQLGGVSGRQISIDNRKTIFGYYSHLFNDALHLSRVDQLNGNPENKFFPMSGYIMAVKKNLFDFEIPLEILVDDAYISYKIYNQGKRIGYNPNAVAYVSYPKNYKDYLKQKIRSTGGYLNLKEHISIPKTAKSRTALQDLKFVLFPIQFAKNPRELLWSLMLYSLRFNLWLRIFTLKLVAPAKLKSSWLPVKSTK